MIRSQLLVLHRSRPTESFEGRALSGTERAGRKECALVRCAIESRKQRARQSRNKEGHVYRSRISKMAWVLGLLKHYKQCISSSSCCCGCFFLSFVCCCCCCCCWWWWWWWWWCESSTPRSKPSFRSNTVVLMFLYTHKSRSVLQYARKPFVEACS